MKFKIFKFKKVKSTNDTAIGLIKNNKKYIGCVYADMQTKGKGARGKKWISRKGNLFSTLFFPMKGNYPPFNEFSLINPIIISNVIKIYCTKGNITFKFPNDIYVNDKKICGILQEVINFKKKKFLIIGIGLNIISNPSLKKNYQATNIYLESKNEPQIKEIIGSIISAYESFFINLSSYNYVRIKKKIKSMTLN